MYKLRKIESEKFNSRIQTSFKKNLGDLLENVVGSSIIGYLVWGVMFMRWRLFVRCWAGMHLEGRCVSGFGWVHEWVGTLGRAYE